MPEFTPDQIDARIEADPQMKKLAQNDPTAFLAQHTKMYHVFGYRPDGTPLPMAQKAIGNIARTTGLPEGLVHGIAAAPLPILGTMAGMAVGSPGGAVGAAIGASGGSVLGEAGNSLLGITDPMSTADIGIAAAAPVAGLGIGRAVPAAIKIGKRLLPGVGAGLNELAGETLTAKLNSMRVTKADVDAMRGILSTAEDFKIDVPLTRALFQSESGTIGRQAAAGIPETTTYLKELNTQIKNLGTTGKVSFKDLMTLEQGFNRIKGGRPDELWGKASGLIVDDMEAALSNPALTTATKTKVQEGLTAFKSFIATNRKYQADESLTSILKTVVKEVPGESNMVMFDQKAFKTQLKNNQVLNKAFNPVEIAAIKDSVADLGYISKPPSIGGDVLSLGKRYGAGGILGGLGAHMMGGSAMVGAPVGMAVEEVIRKAVSSESGRRIVKYLAKTGRGQINMLELNSMLGKATAGVMAGVAGINQPAGEVLTTSQNQE
jgi:hypothetical protein